MEFNGGGGIVGLDPGGGYIPPNNVQQNQANLNYVNAVNQASLNPNTLYGPGGFGYQTNQYSAAGAAYGRQTGYYGDPYSATPVSPSSGAGYADRSTLDDAGQAYYDAHVARYGAPPYADNPGVQGPAGPPAPPAPPPPAAQPSVMEQAAASDAGGGAGIGVGPRTDPGEGAAVDFNSLNAQQQSYYQAHIAKYGTAPGAGNTTLTGMADSGGPSSGGGAGTQFSTPFTPSGPVASDPYSGGGHPTDPGEGAALDPSTWNAAQKAYADAHVLKYNTLPGANNATMKSLADAPPPMAGGEPFYPGVGQPAPAMTATGDVGQSPGMAPGYGGFDNQPYSSLSDAQQQYVQAHVARYGSPPPMSFFTGTGPLSWNSMYGGGGEPAPFQSATGNVGQSPGMSTGMGGFNNQPGDAVRSDLTPVQQGYYDQHVARYGYAPPASFFTGTGPLSWNTMYGGGAGTSTLGGIGAGTGGDAASFNERFTGSPAPDTSGVAAINKAAGIDPNTGLQIGSIDPNTGQIVGSPSPTAPDAGRALEFTGKPVNSSTINQISPGAGSFTPVSQQQQWLADQRATVATSIADNPELLTQLAARIYTEDSNSPEGQQAVFEAMLNNQIATSFDAKGNPVKGVDMLGPGYYPKAGSAGDATYQKNLALMQNNPGLLGQMREVMAKVFQGSNVSQGAFGWSQGNSPQAASDLANANLVYTSPKTGADFNVFYRPTGASFGPGYIAGQNYWLSQMPP